MKYVYEVEEYSQDSRHYTVESEVKDFPEPLSPTNDKVSPSFKLKDILLTTLFNFPFFSTIIK